MNKPEEKKKIVSWTKGYRECTASLPTDGTQIAMNVWQRKRSVFLPTMNLFEGAAKIAFPNWMVFE